MTLAPAPARSLAQEVERHLGLVLTSAGALLLVTRVYVASGRETGTSLAMLRSAGLLPTALGVVTTLLPALAVVLTTGTLLLTLHDLLAGRRPGRARLAAAVAVVSAAFVPVSSDTLVRTAALLVLPAAVLLLGASPRLARRTWAAAVAGLLGLNVLTSSALWLPAERVTVRAADGSEVVHVGYALDDGSALRLLNHAPRLVLQLDPDDVTERVLCRLDAGGAASDRDSVLSFLLARVDVGSPRSGAPAC